MWKLFVILYSLAAPNHNLERIAVDTQGTVQTFVSESECKKFATEDAEFLLGMKHLQQAVKQTNQGLPPEVQMQLRTECAQN